MTKQTQRTPHPKRPIGRPKSDLPARLEKITMPVTVDEKTALAKAAQSKGQTVAGYVRARVFPLP